MQKDESKIIKKTNKNEHNTLHTLIIALPLSTNLFTNDHDLLGCQIFKREDKSPVEVALTIQGPVMDISFLRFVLTM